ncbi:hypothetical protein UCREL1_11808 [Eutypa lata UCREL1]|uniref:EthD domain-containing protein n=1 Tax=Eutypa lata (strain UCR-EL1) TaxID=1287681 RepID=M7S5C4_EUTLA|nr:hypothetical protein UCREL1_11808 [Eutypa lata UCREL1]
MTFNVLIFASRLPGVTPAEFKTYYDTKHMPMIRTMTGRHFPLQHIRKYIQRDPTTAGAEAKAAVIVGSQADFDFDVVAEMVFEHEDAFKKFAEILLREENAKIVDEDERKFFDRERVRMVVLGGIDVLEREV